MVRSRVTNIACQVLITKPCVSRYTLKSFSQDVSSHTPFRDELVRVFVSSTIKQQVYAVSEIIYSSKMEQATKVFKYRDHISIKQIGPRRSPTIIEQLRQQLRLNNPRLLINQTISLDSSVPRKIERLLLPLPTLCQIDFRHDQLVLGRLRFRYHMSLRIDNAAPADKIKFPIVETAASG